jgi:hypothetical protein
VGTTVAVSELFSPLPVRHREFKKRLKGEFARLVAVLQVGGLAAWLAVALSNAAVLLSPLAAALLPVPAAEQSAASSNALLLTFCSLAGLRHHV